MTEAQIIAMLEELNCRPLFARAGLVFTSVRWRGKSIVATTDEGKEVVWHSLDDLMSFERSQAIIYEATGIVIGD
jgi:hypothetical protein